MNTNSTVRQTKPQSTCTQFHFHGSRNIKLESLTMIERAAVVQNIPALRRGYPC